MAENTEFMTVDNICNRVYFIRGQQVMLDYDLAELPHELMVHFTDIITHEVTGINRVLCDFTPKPTGTVEYE